ncbi:hypothetical protein HOD96_02255 [Candidatus Falkowbacteria bacterium]|jgi:acyl carrier protein|nr:hypothetical protein [Candidatus Falkowbacteria bacterium]MBT4433113.1 hypothetical protein [Candidatus Falkowbacteria bacterium]
MHKTSEIQTRLKKIILDSTDIQNATSNTIIKGEWLSQTSLEYSMRDFKDDLCLGSLEFFALIADVEKEFDIDITDLEIMKVTTVGDFVSLVEKLVPATN